MIAIASGIGGALLGALGAVYWMRERMVRIALNLMKETPAAVQTPGGRADPEQAERHEKNS